MNINFKGITRNTDIGIAIDGECAELINGRVTAHGSIVPIAPPETVATMPDDAKALYVHAGAGFEHIIAINGTQLIVSHKKENGRYISSSVSIGDMGVRPLGLYSVGNVLVVQFAEKNRYFLWKKSFYEEQQMPSKPPSISLKKESAHAAIIYDWNPSVDTDVYKETNGLIMSELNTLAEKTGMIRGDLMVVATYELFDGTEMLASRILHERAESYSAEITAIGVGTLGMAGQGIQSMNYAEHRINGFRGKLSVKAELSDLIKAVKIYAFTDGGENIFEKQYMTYASEVFDSSKTKFTLKFHKQREKTASKAIEDMPNLFYVKTLGISEFERSGEVLFDLGVDTSLIQRTFTESDRVYPYKKDLKFGEYMLSIDRIETQAQERAYIADNLPKSSQHLNDRFYHCRYVSPNLIRSRQALDVTALSKDVYGESFASKYNDLYNGRIHAYGLTDRASSNTSTLSAGGTASSGRIAIEDKDGNIYLLKYDDADFAQTISTQFQGFIVNNGSIKSATISFTNQSQTKVCKIKLTQHGSLPISYLKIDKHYHNGAAQSLGSVIDSAGVLSSMPSEQHTNLERSGVLRVSSTHNPMHFPLANTYQFSGSIVGTASQVEAISEGQFGQFPLYVFTTEGIYTMSVGTSGIAYSNSTPISRDVCVNRASICPVRAGVVYATDEHIKIIQGRETALLSEKVEGWVPNIFEDTNIKKVYNKLVGNSSGLLSYKEDKATGQIVAVPIISERTEFSDYIRGARVRFEPESNAIIVSNKQAPYSYMYFFDSGQWSKWGYTPTDFLNSYPECLFTKNGFIFNAYNHNRSMSPFMLITRAMKFGTDELKRASQFAFRGTFIKALSKLYYRGREIVHPENKGQPLEIFGRLDFYIFASQDGETYTPITGKENISQMRNIVTGLMRTNAYRYYTAILVGAVRTDMSISYLEVDVKQTLNNRLR